MNTDGTTVKVVIGICFSGPRNHPGRRRPRGPRGTTGTARRPHRLGQSVIARHGQLLFHHFDLRSSTCLGRARRTERILADLVLRPRPAYRNPWQRAPSRGVTGERPHSTGDGASRLSDRNETLP
jgi:hypothetical protein